MSALANLILVLHALFVAVVVFSVPLIMIGGWRKWRWVRNPYFRYGHVTMIAFVAAESLIGMTCQLTVWENDLRADVGKHTYEEGGFIASWLHRLMYYSFPAWVFTAVYVAFGLLVLSLLYAVPPRRSRSN